MSIKATVDGTQYSDITTINAGGKVVSLSETGTITTPTATLNKSVTVNGEQTIDVTNYKYIKITTNVPTSSSGGSSDTPATKTLSSISAVANPTSYAVGTSASSLSLTVTATYSDSTTETVTGWTATGTVAEGSNTFTISYGEKTTTVTVTGVASSTPSEDTEGALHPLKNGTYTSSDGDITVVITNGNHVKVTRQTTGSNVEIVLDNASTSKIGSSPLNSQSALYTLNGSVHMEISNLTFDPSGFYGSLSYINKAGNGSYNPKITLYKREIMSSDTTVSNLEVGSLMLVLNSNSTSTTMEFDISVTVDGTQYI